MRVVSACAEELRPFFQAMLADDRETAGLHKARIDELEHEADDLKNELRSRLPRHLFMPVDRRDLLHLLGAQDSIADRAQDIAAIITVRQMQIPDFFKPGLPGLVARVLDTVHLADEIVGELDDLLESGFRGSEIERCEGMIVELSKVETETDLLGVEMMGILFDHETEISPLRAMYWQRVAQMIVRIADHAENVGDRLRLLIAR